MEERCERCRYWKDANVIRAGFGHCKRMPPSLVTDGSGAGRGLFPMTGLSEWCGEFRVGLNKEPGKLPVGRYYDPAL